MGRCEALLTTAVSWWVEPAIASASFALWTNLFSAAEAPDSFARRLWKPPYSKTCSGFASLLVYWFGVAGWVAVVPPPHGVEHGCPGDARGLLWLCAEVASGIVAYDFLFFWVHLSMHVVPRLGWLAGHGRHHQFDAAGAPGEVSCHRVVHHSLVDGGLQVLVNILVQRMTPWGSPKRRLARWCHNVLVTSMLTEAHSTEASPHIFRRLCSGVRDHHLHHHHRGPPFQQFFGYLDRLCCGYDPCVRGTPDTATSDSKRA